MLQVLRTRGSTKILVQGGVVPSLIEDSTSVNTMLTGSFWPLAFCLTWQAVPGPVILCTLLLIGQFQFMALQPINFTSIKGVGTNSHFAAQQTGDQLHPQA